MKRMNLEALMDILDWYDDGLYDYIDHILLTKVDGAERVRRTMPQLRKYTQESWSRHTGARKTPPLKASEQHSQI